MTEGSSSTVTPDQNSPLTEIHDNDVRPEQNSHNTESNCSDMRPEQNLHNTESNCFDMRPEQNLHNMESNCSDMNPDQEAHSTESTEDGSPGPDLEGQLIYRCKKCRQIVASQKSIVSHQQGKGEASFRGRKNGVEPDSPECTAIFVEPLKWMQAVEEGYLWEKLYCMACKTKLGSFNWAGMQCSCGAWVTPAFQILKSRVDECRI